MGITRTNTCRYDEKENIISYCLDFYDSLAANHNGKGLVLFAIGSLHRDTTWNLPALKSGLHSTSGIRIAYCPFCGTHITPLIKKEQEASK